MSMPSSFDIGRQVGNNFANVRREAKDEGAIDRILSEAVNSGDPAMLQNSIGKILSQVSPERQGVAVQFLQNKLQSLEAKQKEDRLATQGKDAANAAGYTYGAPPQVQAQQVKEKAKGSRLAEYGLTPAQSNNSPSNVPTAENGTSPYLTGVEGNQPIQPPAPLSTPPKSIFKKLTDDQLVVATGAPDREISEPAKAELKERQEQKKIDQKVKTDVFKSDLNRSEKVLERADTIAEQIPQKRTSISLMKDAVANRNLGFFSRDNLAEITGIEGFRSPEGAIFKTAGKEYFLGNIARAGARPNQWIEQQISDMMAKVGRSPEANFSVLRALENELDLDEARVRITNEISDKLRSEGDYGQGKLGSMVNKELSKYAEEKQDVLFNDLRAIKAISEKTPQKFRKVTKGTKVSDFMAQALLQTFNNDPDKAAEEAKKLGYDFE